MRYVTRFGTICTIFKKVKSTRGEVLLLVKLQTFQDLACNLAKSNTPSWVFFTSFKLYNWYQIEQSVSYVYVT